MDAAEFASGNPEVARGGRSDRDDNRIVLLLQPLRGDVLPDLAVRDEPNSLRLQHLAPAVYERLVELEARDPVAEESADVLPPLVHGHRESAPAQGDGGRKARGPRADHGDGPAVLPFRRTRHDPAVRESRLDDALLRLPHHDSLFVESVHAARLAQCRTYPRGELGEVGIRREERVGTPPVALRHCAVLVWDQIPERTPVCMAERLSAVHAARGLLLEFFVSERALDLAPVIDAFIGRTVDVVYSLHIVCNLAQPMPSGQNPILPSDPLQFL